MGYELEQHVRRLERTVIDLQRAVDRLRRDLLKVAQDQRGGGFFGGGDPNAGGGGGHYWCSGDPIPSNDAATMTVYEIRAAGDVSLGPQTVVNRWADPTADGRMVFLNKVRDGYSVANEDCLSPPPDEE